MSLRRSAAAVAVATVLLASAAWASPWTLKPGEFYSELSGQFFSARTYLQNEDGHRIQFNGALEQREVSSHTELGWKKRASVSIDLPFVSRTFAEDAGGSVTSTGLGDIGLGLRWALHRGAAPVAIELGWTAPLGGNRRLFPGINGSGGLDGTSYAAQAGGPVRDSSAFFDSGLQSLRVALELGAPLGKRAYYTLGGGYETHFLTLGSRDSTSRYLDLVTASASLGVWSGSHLLLSGNFAGGWSVSQSNLYDRIAAPVPGSHGPDLKPESLAAGSRLTYRVDERMDVFAGTWHTLSGRNVLHTDEFFAGIAWKQTGLDRLAGALGGTRAH